MPKHPKRPRDPSRLAKMLVDVASGEIKESAPESRSAAEIGAKGGRARAMRLTPDQRAEAASLAAQARWRKK
jgi:hypothetical protein